MSDAAGMRVRVRLFAMQRQQTGLRELELDLPEGATVAQAWRTLVDRLPVLAPARPAIRFARNGTYVDAGETLAEGDELALIPPVAGGADGGTGVGMEEPDGGAIGEPGHAEPLEDPRIRRIELHAEPFGVAILGELRAALGSPRDGAVLLFVGQTRETPGTPAPGQEDEAARHAGQRVTALDYEAFESMALAVLEAIAVEIEVRFGVHRLAILHRVGEVPLGEASVVIGVAAPHRDSAFEACRYAIEELKARAPIWKSERFVDGSVWSGAPARHGPVEDASRGSA